MDKSQSYSSDFFTAPEAGPVLTSGDRVNMVKDLLHAGASSSVLMYATDKELVSLHRVQFPNPFMVAVEKVLSGSTLGR
jgi:hypothetical protein